jgi:asparagine synthetase B (glutamine-hydrolysing)
MSQAIQSTPSCLASSVLDLSGIEVGVRPAVHFREQACGRSVSLYLSLYDDELEERAEAFWSRGTQGGGRPPWSELELTDALLHVDPDGAVSVARGAACTFPLYYTKENGRLRFSTSLPVLQGAPLSRSGLLTAAAGACLHSSYEVNALTETPVAGWRRLRRGAVTRFDGPALSGEEYMRPKCTADVPTRESVCREVRSAFDAYSASQKRTRSSVVEASGGFDSTLAAAIPCRRGMRGVSVMFPYYEFRFERAVQQATAEYLGIPRDELDGTRLFPYSPASVPVRFDEPSVFVTGIRHAEEVARYAARCGAERIYTGHGGDQCFATDLLEREPLVSNSLESGPFSSKAWSVVRRAMDIMRGSDSLDRSLGTLVYDARPDVWIRETFGPAHRTPFSDLRVFRSALAWSRWCKEHQTRPDKSILAEAAGDLLPQAVVARRGKVAYDGVWMRAYYRNASRIAALFEEVSGVLAHIGVSPQWLQQRALELGEWRDRSDREVLAFYGIAFWLSAWGITRVSDVAWKD